VWAMLSVGDGSVEITRIECDEAVRGTGRFVAFVNTVAAACRVLGRALVLGCVESDRLRTLVRRHRDVWRRLPSDPTSYEFVR